MADDGWYKSDIRYDTNLWTNTLALLHPPLKTIHTKKKVAQSRGRCRTIDNSSRKSKSNSHLHSPHVRFIYLFIHCIRLNAFLILHFDSCRDPPFPGRRIPERFMQNKRHKGSYLPSGEGPRNCGGAQLKVTLLHLVKNFKMKLSTDTSWWSNAQLRDKCRTNEFHSSFCRKLDLFNVYERKYSIVQCIFMWMIDCWTIAATSSLKM